MSSGLEKFDALNGIETVRAIAGLVARHAAAMAITDVLGSLSIAASITLTRPLPRLQSARSLPLYTFR
jgi:hypothetical protein